MLIIFWFKRGTAMPISLSEGPEKTFDDGYGNSSPRYSVRTTMPFLSSLKISQVFTHKNLA